MAKSRAATSTCPCPDWEDWCSLCRQSYSMCTAPGARAPSAQPASSGRGSSRVALPARGVLGSLDLLKFGRPGAGRLCLRKGSATVVPGGSAVSWQQARSSPRSAVTHSGAASVAKPPRSVGDCRAVAPALGGRTCPRACCAAGRVRALSWGSVAPEKRRRPPAFGFLVQCAGPVGSNQRPRARAEPRGGLPSHRGTPAAGWEGTGARTPAVLLSWLLVSPRCSLGLCRERLVKTLRPGFRW